MGQYTAASRASMGAKRGAGRPQRDHGNTGKYPDVDWRREIPMWPFHSRAIAPSVPSLLYEQPLYAYDVVSLLWVLLAIFSEE